MFKKIEIHFTCEMQPVIRFLNAKNMTPAEIHRQLRDVYGEHAMSSSMARSGCDCLMKNAKMCMMIRGVADRLW